VRAIEKLDRLWQWMC